ncbi:MAG: MerR family transcriptional regulator [Rhodothalassiaceae bacterium]
MSGLTRTQLAARAGCHAEAVRHYERMRLLPEPPRSAGGHRRYDERHLARLRLILSGRNLGMTTDDLAALLSLLDSAAPPPARRRAATRRLARLVTARLQDLDRLLALADRLNSGND